MSILSLLKTIKDLPASCIFHWDNIVKGIFGESAVTEILTIKFGNSQIPIEDKQINEIYQDVFARQFIRSEIESSDTEVIVHLYPSNELPELQNLLAEKEQMLTQTTADLDELRQKLAESAQQASEDLANYTLEMEHKQSQIAQLQEDVKRITESVKEQDFEGTLQENNRLRDELNKEKARADNLEESKTRQRVEFMQFLKAIPLNQESLQSLENEAENGNQETSPFTTLVPELLAVYKDRDLSLSNCQNLQEQINTLEEEKGTLTQDLQTSNTEIQRISQEADTLQMRVGNLEQVIEKLQENFHKFVNSLSLSQEKKDDLYKLYCDSSQMELPFVQLAEAINSAVTCAAKDSTASQKNYNELLSKEKAQMRQALQNILTEIINTLPANEDKKQPLLILVQQGKFKDAVHRISEELEVINQVKTQYDDLLEVSNRKDQTLQELKDELAEAKLQQEKLQNALSELERELQTVSSDQNLGEKLQAQVNELQSQHADKLNKLIEQHNNIVVNLQTELEKLQEALTESESNKTKAIEDINKLFDLLNTLTDLANSLLELINKAEELAKDKAKLKLTELQNCLVNAENLIQGFISAVIQYQIHFGLRQDVPEEELSSDGDTKANKIIIPQVALENNGDDFPNDLLGETGFDDASKHDPTLTFGTPESMEALEQARRMASEAHDNIQLLPPKPLPAINQQPEPSQLEIEQILNEPFSVEPSPVVPPLYEPDAFAVTLSADTSHIEQLSLEDAVEEDSFDLENTLPCVEVPEIESPRNGEKEPIPSTQEQMLRNKVNKSLK